MAVNTSKPLGAMTGARYIESLQDNREVWLDGKKVEDVTTHPALTGMVNELARIYDLQHSAELGEEMTFLSPETGNRCSLSWQLPTSRRRPEAQAAQQRDLERTVLGAVGAAAPDILAPHIITLYNSREALAAVKNPHCDFGENIANYHRHCLEKRPVPDPRPGRPPGGPQRAAAERATGGAGRGHRPARGGGDQRRGNRPRGQAACHRRAHQQRDLRFPVGHLRPPGPTRVSRWPSPSPPTAPA